MVWDYRYPQISRNRLSDWTNLVTFFAYPADIRKAIYTTIAIESQNSMIHHKIKKHKVCPTDDSVKKVAQLVIQSTSQRWIMPLRDSCMAMNHFIIGLGNHLDGLFQEKAFTQNPKQARSSNSINEHLLWNIALASK